MSRRAALGLLLLALAPLAPGARAQMRGARASMPVAQAIPSHHRVLRPVAPALPAAPPASAQPAVAPPASARSPQPQCAQGNCAPGAAASGALVVPVHSPSELVQQGSSAPLPAAAVSASPQAGIGMGAYPGTGVLPGAQPPLPRQPLSDVLRNGPTIRITIRAISAQRGPSALEIDGRLAPIDRDLRSFADQFSYRNYRLLDVQTFDLDFRSIAQMELPGGRAIEVEPRQFGPDGRVKVHLELLGQHPEHAARMRTDASIPRGRTILVGGYRIDPAAPEGGTLLLAITQDQ